MSKRSKFLITLIISSPPSGSEYRAQATLSVARIVPWTWSLIEISKRPRWLYNRAILCLHQNAAKSSSGASTDSRRPKFEPRRRKIVILSRLDARNIQKHLDVIFLSLLKPRIRCFVLWHSGPKCDSGFSSMNMRRNSIENLKTVNELDRTWLCVSHSVPATRESLSQPIENRKNSTNSTSKIEDR